MPFPKDKPYEEGWHNGEFELRRIRPVKQVQVSPDYAALLADELDSDAYARKLVNRQDNTLLLYSMGSRAGTDRRKLLAWSGSKGRGRTVRPSPEYLRFLGEEITSREYAISVARYAHLEELYRSPSRAPSRGPRRKQMALRFLDQLRLGLWFGLLPLLALALPPLLAVSSLDFASVSTVPWVISFTGIVILGLTVIAARSSTLRGWIHATGVWSEDW